jgi:hypothetical protein
VGIGQCRDPLALPGSGAAPVYQRVMEDAPSHAIESRIVIPVLQVRPTPARCRDDKYAVKGTGMNTREVMLRSCMRMIRARFTDIEREYCLKKFLLFINKLCLIYFKT